MKISPVSGSKRWLAAVLALMLVFVAWAMSRGHAPLPASTAAASNPAMVFDLSHVQRQAAASPGTMHMSFMPVTAIKPQIKGLLRYGELLPARVANADIIFLHGHADRLDNHLALFKAWQASGARVISLDWPSHGQSDVGPLDIYEADELIALVQQVEQATLQDPQRPLVLAAWSYGGLIATRLLQQPGALRGLSRRPSGLLLLAPGVVVQPFVGGDGIARVETLLHAPYPILAGPPSPPSPLMNPVFALRTLVLAWQAQHSTLPTDIPVQVIVADDDNDWYVNTRGIVAWARQQQAAGVPLQLAQCVDARHALDNEPWPIGERVRNLGVEFVQQVRKTAVQAGLPAEAAQPALQSACKQLPKLGAALVAGAP